MAQENIPAEDWRARARHARALASMIRDFTAKCEMLKVAESYERLAEKAEKKSSSG